MQKEIKIKLTDFIDDIKVSEKRDPNNLTPALKGVRTRRDAFCLVTYKCKDCGYPETLWNNRSESPPYRTPCVE